MSDSKSSTDLVPRGRQAGMVAGEQTSDAIARIDARISDPATPVHEALILTRIRREIIDQEESRLDRDCARRAQARQFWGKLAFSVGAVGTGLGLITFGLPLEGFLILGVGFHWLAPDFVKSIYGRAPIGKDKRDE